MGLGREELRERALPGVAPDVARALLDRLATARDIRLEKELAALPTHEVAVAGEDEALLLLVESAFGEAGLNPPTLEEVIAARRLHAAKAQRIYHLLLSRGRLVRIRDGTVYHAEAVARLKESLWKLREERAVIDVAAFKELTGTSRKNAIPLLEHLDAERVTRRRGNDREILPPPGAATP
ncbi:MAG TPA: SelB C-terminal domain-containing protein, partial [Verrucomicrobiae bacterium]|nr:SelB C-terminal domain-containing protein [Verrucomicrobiae bacterium]